MAAPVGFHDASVVDAHKQGQVTLNAHPKAEALKDVSGYHSDAVAKSAELQAKAKAEFQQKLQGKGGKAHIYLENLDLAGTKVHSMYSEALNEAYASKQKLLAEKNGLILAKDAKISTTSEALSAARTEANENKKAASDLEKTKGELKTAKAERDEEKNKKGGLGWLGVSGISAATALVCILAVYLTMEHRDKKLIKNNSTLKVQLQQAQQSLQAQQQAASSSGGYGSDPTNGMFGS